MKGIRNKITLGRIDDQLVAQVPDTGDGPLFDHGPPIWPLKIEIPDRAKADDQDWARFHLAVGQAVAQQLLRDGDEDQPPAEKKRASCTDEDAWEKAKEFGVITAENLTTIDGVGEHRANRLIEKWLGAGLILSSSDDELGGYQVKP